MNKLVRLKMLDKRIPKWLNPFVNRNCPLCNKVNPYKFIRPDSAYVSLCDICDLWYVSRGPNQQSLDYFYTNYHKSHSTNVYEESLFAAIVKTIFAPSIISTYIKNRISRKRLSILDFGCGTGKLLFELKQCGHRVIGIDIDPDARKACAKKRIQTYPSIQKLESLCERFDVIVLSDVIEQFFHPEDLIQRLSRLLSAEGCIILVSPNGEKIHLENDPICLRVDLEHMQYFTCKSYLTIASNCDMRISTYVLYGDPSLSNIMHTDSTSGTLSAARLLSNRVEFHLRSLCAALKIILFPPRCARWPPLISNQYHSFVSLHKSRP
jgi:2-polyprenyl-3-methyl-5-hydroxy-6-metoxy-1,4-benzoquinol methylase